MRTIVTFLVAFFFCNAILAQFGGGIGTEEDPYRVYSKDHMEDLSDSVLNGNSYTGQYFTLMNNIDDSLRIPIGMNDQFPFNGNFHGNGHNIVLAIDLRESAIDYGSNSLFPLLGSSGMIDSLSVTGYIFACNGIVGENYGSITFVNNYLTSPFSQAEYSQFVIDKEGIVETAGICKSNFGEVNNCANYAPLNGTMIGGICYYNQSEIYNCLNEGSLIFYNNLYEVRGGGISCINMYETGIIENCKNKDNFTFIGNENSYNIGGIVGSNADAKVNLCQNYGHITGKVSSLGGIVGFSQGGTIQNSSNYGNINGSELIGGILGYSDVNINENCFNSGTISGEGFVGGICGFSSNDTTLNCLNIARAGNSAIICDTLASYMIGNFYDKQMCIKKGIADADVLGSAEGKLTTHIIGTNPELQVMLGDGWSYAEGRYPIPLGLENDSMALVAASPIYLHALSEYSYNHVDSVSKNFTVSLENNVSWDETNSRVNITDENVTLLSIGTENLIVSLGAYSKKVRINIVDIEVSIQDQTLENYLYCYPNPATEKIWINLNDHFAEKIEIYDVTGSIVLSTSNFNEKSAIDISGLTSGVYLIRSFNKNEKTKSIRFIKN